MKVIEVQVKSIHDALASAAKIHTKTTRGVIVRWQDYHNEVEFKIHGERFELEVVRCDGDRERVWMSTEWKELPKDHRRLALAAALHLRLKCFFVNKELVVMEREPVRSEPTRTLELEIEEPVRHESRWKGAQAHGISGHRKEVKQESDTGLGALILGLGLLALGAGKKRS